MKTSVTGNDDVTRSEDRHASRGGVPIASLETASAVNGRAAEESLETMLVLIAILFDTRSIDNNTSSSSSSSSGSSKNNKRYRVGETRDIAYRISLLITKMTGRTG